jgi:RNA polymerase sigma-70 factor (ECF subfamily)
MEEAELVERIRAAQGGDRAALEEVSRDLYQTFLPLVRKRVPQEDDAEQVVMEVLLRVLRGLKELRDPTQIRPWVWTIVLRVLMEWRRCKGRVGRWEPLDKVDERRSPKPEGLDPENEEEVARAAFIQRISPGGDLAELLHEAEQRLLGYLQEGLSPAEIAEMEGVTANAMRCRLRRLRAKIRELYKRYPGEGFPQ